MSTPAAREPVWSAPGFRLLMLQTVLGFAGYAALLPLVPAWAVHGGADSAGAGLVNGVLLAVTVICQFLVPAALRRLGWGPVMAGGLLLLGLPSLGHLVSDDLPWILLLAALRGVGFAVLSVTGSAATAHLVHVTRRGAAVGAYGLAVTVPNLTLLPWGPTVVEALGWWPMFVLGTLPVLGAPVALAVARHLPRGAEKGEHAPAGASSPEPGEGRGAPGSGAAYLALLAPAVVLLVVTLSGGAVISFAPELVTAPWLATAALLVLGAASAAARWRVGTVADRHGAGHVVWPMTVLAAGSTAGLAVLLGLGDTGPVGPSDALVLLTLVGGLGLAYGALQNLTYVISLAVAGPRRISTAAATWNAGFDTGTAVGSVAVGAIAAGWGFGWGMLVAATVCALTLPLAWGLKRVA